MRQTYERFAIYVSGVSHLIDLNRLLYVSGVYHLVDLKGLTKHASGVSHLIDLKGLLYASSVSHLIRPKNGAICKRRFSHDKLKGFRYVQAAFLAWYRLKRVSI